jgi:ribosomal protein S12 methylthiotransferase accessory factor
VTIYSDRLFTAEETLARVEPLLGSFGITRVARHTGLDNIGIPVWCAYTPNSRSIVVAQGKGLTDDDARISAVMEALERVVAGEPDLQTIHATAAELAGNGARTKLLEGLIATRQSPPRENEAIAWALARNLLTGEPVHVPAQAALLDRTPETTRYWISSDGLASGNTMDEAILHALLERIERDAHVLWEISSLQKRRDSCIDPRAFGDAELMRLAGQIESADMALRLFEVTSDIAIPAFLSYIGPADIHTNSTIRYVEVTQGSGAHPSPVRAAIRAVTEAAQSRLTFISGARDDVYHDVYKQPLPETTRQTFAAIPKLRPIPDVVVPTGVPLLLRHVLSALAEAGITDVLALPLSAANLPFSVARVFLPALENPGEGRARRFGSRAIAKALFA